MKRFHCQCGEEIFFDNSQCLACGRLLGYVPALGTLLSLETDTPDSWRDHDTTTRYRLCGNRIEYGVCNGLVETGDDHPLCQACRLNRTVPDMSRFGNLARWSDIERAKRRLVYGLLSLGLRLDTVIGGERRRMCFDFIEDQRTNPDVFEQFVTTGHKDGVITLNILEADEVQRVWQRQQNSERYRTVLGHLRHEAGHFYFEQLIGDRSAFIALFGDPDLPYAHALQSYYAHGPGADWASNHISAYASAHPMEDWAECFAHYLHMEDTLETACSRGVFTPLPGAAGIDDHLAHWNEFAVTLNELNRSLGLHDAYPFVVTSRVAEKLHLIDEVIRRQAQ